MSPVSTLVLTMPRRTDAQGDSWGQLAHKGKTPALLDRQDPFALEHHFEAPQSHMSLFAVRFVGKINGKLQKLNGQTGNTEAIRCNTLLKNRKIFRLLIETPKKSAEVLLTAKGTKHE